MHLKCCQFNHKEKLKMTNTKNILITLYFIFNMLGFLFLFVSMKYKLKVIMKLGYKFLNKCYISNFFSSAILPYFYLIINTILPDLTLKRVKIKNSLSVYQSSSLWEGLTTLDSLPLYNFWKPKFPLQFSSLNRHFYYFISTIFNINFLIFLIKYYLLYFLNSNMLVNYLNNLPCGYYLVERFPFEWEYSLLSYWLQLDTMFYVILLFTFLITFIVINLMIIFIIMILVSNFKLYKNIVFIILIYSKNIYNINKLMKW